MKITSLDDINSWVQAFMSEVWANKIISLSGWSSAEKVEWADPEAVRILNESVRNYVNSVLEVTFKRLADYRVVILTWWTEGGVPEDGARLAKKYGFHTIGVYPARWAKRALWDDVIDCAVEVGSVFWESMWWDESPVFAKLADASIVLGGWAGTLVEVSHILKINESLLDKGKRPKFIVPISGIPGIGWYVQTLPWKTHVKRATFPDHEIKTGQQVADYLERILSLEDDHKDNDRK